MLHALLAPFLFSLPETWQVQGNYELHATDENTEVERG